MKFNIGTILNNPVIPAQAGIQRFYSNCLYGFASALRSVIFLTGFRPAPE
jgi:hypothetical protein